MIHFVPESPETASELPGPYAEAIARLASIRQALACVEQFAGEQPTDSMAEAKLSAAWPGSSPAKQRVYDMRSARTAAAAAAGLDLAATLQDSGQVAHDAAIKRLKRELGDGIDSIDLLFSL